MLDAVEKENLMQVVTIKVNNQLFGFNVENVQDVLRYSKLSPIPIAPSFIGGALNLRGRIVTAIDLRAKLDLDAMEDITKSMFIVIAIGNNLYSIIVDSVGDVITFPIANLKQNPENISSNWKQYCAGVLALEQELLLVLDIHKLVDEN